MPAFQVTFVNDTESTWTMAAFQTQPGSVGLASVSWMQAAAPRNGRNVISWEATYDVALAVYQRSAGATVYSLRQILSAAVGTAWKVVFANGALQLQADGQALTKDTLVIRNVSRTVVTAGLGMSGAGAIYRPDLPSGAGVQFSPPTTSWVALFDAIEPGRLITDRQPSGSAMASRLTTFVGPVQLSFPGNVFAATVTATLGDGYIALETAYGKPPVVEAMRRRG
jgi:hypothetical protein